MKPDKILRNPLVLLGFITLVGAVLRLTGIDHGLPYLYSFDEPIFVDKARHMLAAKDPNPRWFGAPASTVIYLLMILYVFLFVGGKLTGFFGGVQDFKELYYTDPTLFYLSGRLMNMAFSVALIPLVYLVAQTLLKRSSLSLIAAALVSVSPLMIHNATLVRMDTLMTLLLLGAFYCCLRVVDQADEPDPGREIKLYCASGFLMGLAIVTKYPSVVFTATIVSTYGLTQGWKQKGLQKIIYSVLSCLGGAFIGSPFLFLNFGQVLQDLAFEARSEHVGATGEGFFANVFWYFLDVFPKSFTHLGLTFFAIGLVLIAIKRQSKLLLLLTFPLLLLGFISSLSLRWERWLLPALPFMAIVIAYALDEGSKQLSHLGKTALEKRSHWLALGLATVLSLPMLTTSVVQAQERTGLDTRTAAREWILENVEPQSRLMMEVYAPQLPSEQFTYFWAKGGPGKIAKFEPDQSEHKTFRVEWSIVGQLSPEDIHGKDIDYVVLSSMYDRYSKEKNPNTKILGNYQAIFDSSELVYEVDRTPGKTKGPKIRVYKVDKDSLVAQQGS